MTLAPESIAAKIRIHHMEMRKIVKRFPGVLANDHVDFDVHAGEVHALLGENGAGKSTLLASLAAFRKPNGGRITLDGQDPYENAGLMAATCLIRESGDFADLNTGQALALVTSVRSTFSRPYAEELLERCAVPYVGSRPPAARRAIDKAGTKRIATLVLERLTGENFDDYIRKQTMVNAERYITPELKEYETLVLNAEEEILKVERELFDALCRQLCEAAPRLLHTARALAHVDVFLSLASVAVLNMDDAGDIAPAAAMGMMIFYTNAAARIIHLVASRGIYMRTQAWRRR